MAEILTISPRCARILNEMNLLNVNANLYKYFLAVYEHRHVGRASERFLLTPSALSQNLRTLSNQLGVRKLFTPNPKGVVPTADAVALYPIANEMYGLMVKAEQSVKTFDENSVAVIRLGITSLMCGMIGDCFKEFKQKYPKVSFQFFNKDSTELLQRNKIDFIINVERDLNKFDFSTVPLFDMIVFLSLKGII